MKTTKKVLSTSAMLGGVCLALCLGLAACDYQPWEFSSTTESESEIEPTPFDPTTIDYQNIEFDVEFSGDELDNFLEKTYKNTKKVKTTDVLAHMENNEYDGKLIRTNYDLTGYNMFFDNKVAKAELYFDENTYFNEIQFMRYGNYYDYYYSVAEDEEEEYCYKGQTAKTDLWDCFDFPLIHLVQEAFDEEDYVTGLFDDKTLSVYTYEKTGTTYIDKKDIERLTVEQTIIEYEKCDTGYRVKTMTFFDKTLVKYDFDKLEPSSKYNLRSLDQVHIDFDYDAEVGNFDEELLQHYIDIAKE